MDRLSLSEYIQKIIFPAFGITMEVLFFTVIISTIIGFIIAIILDITRPDGMYPNKIFFNIMDTFINLIRSFPFMYVIQECLGRIAELQKEERYCTKYNITPLIYMNDTSEFKFT